MEVIKKYKNQIWFHLLLNVVFLVLITYSTFYHIPLPSLKDRFTYLLLLLLLQFTVFGFLYFLSLSKYAFAVIFPLFFLVFGISAYFVYTQDIIINEGVVHATLETKPDIVADLISLPLFVFGFAIIGFSIYFVRRLFRIQENNIRSPLTIVALMGIAAFFFVSFKRPSTFRARLPYNIYYSAKAYFEKPEINFKEINFKVTAAEQDLHIILVLGESVRADHLGINGYKRQTTPKLSVRKNLISYPNVFTSKTYTAISLMQILTDQSVYDQNKSEFFSLIDVLNKAGVKTSWIGNQTPENSYLPFISGSQNREMVDPYHSEFSFHKEYDEVLLRNFSNYLKQDQNAFTVLHMMGNHWYYENRYPEKFRVFKPVITSKNVTSNSPEEMVNSYDNAIFYLDTFLDEVISSVEISGRKAIVVYLSDHGEALGENGTWLHAQENPAINKPAMMVWFSEKYLESKGNALPPVKTNTEKITTDFLFPSVLNWYKIKGLKTDTLQILK